jgi:hypothetical protein
MKYKKQNIGSHLTNKMSTDDLGLLGYNGMSPCEWFRIFQRNILPSSSRVSSARGYGASDCLTLENGNTTIPQNLGTSHSMTWQHIAEDLDIGSFNETCTDNSFLLHPICMPT